MLLYIFSIFLVSISSYLLLSCAAKNENKKGFPAFFYFLLIFFSQIVLSFEILSLFKSISKNGLLIFNFILLFISVLLFIYKGRFFYIPDLKSEIRKIKNAFKLDKILGILFISYILFLIFQFISSAFFPVTFGDSLTYYLPRCTSWIQNGSINHYITPDTRELIMPVNMEFLYTWLLLFTKNETGCALFSYIGYIGLAYVLYSFLKELGFSVRKRLWSVFVISSFVLIAIEMYTPCADMFIGTLILGSVYLYYKALKSDNKTALYFSALSYALAVGTKTTAIIAIPAVSVVMLVITLICKKETAKKQIFKFLGLFTLNFIIFSSYNYILNVIQFNNPVSCSEQLLLNQFRGGFKGWLVNIIKYSFTVFDTSGIPDLINFNGFVEYMQANILALIGETNRSYISYFFPGHFPYNRNIGYMESVFGLMGMFAFLPSLVKAIAKGFSINGNKRNTIITYLAMSFVLNILIFSRVMVFTQFNMRYILTFIVIASPVLVYSYMKNTTKFKILISIIMFVYFVVIAHKMPVSYVVSYLKHKASSQNGNFLLAKMDETEIYNYVKSNNIKNIALISSQTRSPNYYIEKLKMSDVHIDKLLLENIEEYHLSDYDYIITAKDNVSSTNIVKFEDRMKYKDLFVSKCLYYDYKQDTITDIKTKPAMLQCEVPYEYFKHKGFILLDDINLKNYNILKNNI